MDFEEGSDFYLMLIHTVGSHEYSGQFAKDIYTALVQIRGLQEMDALSVYYLSQHEKRN